MPSENDRRTYVVTGCSTGIGRATALRLSRTGARVLAGVRNASDAPSADPQTSGAGSIEPITIDVADRASVEAATQQISRLAPDGVHGLVNNAGTAIAGPLEWLPVEKWATQYEVNVFGTVRMTRELLPIVRRGKGRIVNVGSAASRLALPLAGAYASSKFAVEGLTDSLRRELSVQGIRVILVCPGQTATPIFSKAESRAENEFGDLESDGDGGNAYVGQLKRLQSMMHASERRRAKPEKVARAIERALTARRPKRRYHVGLDAKGAVLVDKLIPSAWVDWVIDRQFRNIDR